MPQIAAEPAVSASAAPAPPGTMRAAVVEQPRKLSLREVPVPQPNAGALRVRIDGCGVCASNIPPWEGREWFSYPLEPGRLGHEAWGRIDAIGEGVSGWSIGQRVGMLSNHAYAEYDCAGADAVVALPEPLDGVDFPAEPLGCAMNIFRRCEIRPDDTVAIIGVGFLGALLTRLAADAGARVLAISRREYALDVAQQMGAAETIVMDDHWRIIERVRELTGGRFCDVVIEAAGKQWPLDLSGELTRERGRLVVAGYHQDGPRQINIQLWNWRGLDVINAHERDPAIYLRGMQEAVQAVSSGRLDPSPLYTHRYPLKRLEEALEATRVRPDGFMKALIIM